MTLPSLRPPTRDDEVEPREIVYRHFDREGLARAYDVPASLPQHVVRAHLARYAQASMRVRTSSSARLDLAYGPAPAQKLDVFTTSAPCAPIVVYFHGGGWRRGSKDERAFPAAHLSAAGIIWIPVGTSLCPTVTIEEMIAEARDAVAWVYAHAPTFGGDRRRIYVAGNSAGAHLAAMAAGTHWQNRGLPADVVRGALLCSGVYDFEPLTYHRFPDPAELFRDPAHRRALRSYRWLSPLCHLPRTACDALVAVGGNEPEEFRRQSVDYCDTLRKRGGHAQLLIAQGHDHFSLIGAWAEPDSALFRAVVSLITAAS
ncbi:alpha/beta hydrolase [Haliangium sp.]|uniref:alpha/beta hydrolase n=1 Tax=Haliangium sp. TaxID=2663208 RepID=UPI003D0CA107